MNFSSLFNFSKKCTHDKVPIDADIYYCPDCGELIENQWYIIRCESCGMKEKATIKNGEIVPEEPFCHNCGNKGYKIERLEKINCININYAVLIKQVVENEIKEFTQSWEEVIKITTDTHKLLK